RRGELRRHAARGPDADRSGERRPEEGTASQDPARRRGLVPGFLRAGRRFRPRIIAHTRGGRRCRLCAQRLAALVLVVEDPGHCRELGRCAAELDALWAVTKRNVSQVARGTTGPGAMVMKLAYSEARQRFGELCLRVLEKEALHIEDNELVEERLRVLALT